MGGRGLGKKVGQMKINFLKELESLINRHSKENDSDTPDFILAEYIGNCLHGFSQATRARDKWYDFEPWEEKDTPITEQTDEKL